MNPQQRNTLGFRESVLGKEAFGWVVSGWVLLQALSYLIYVTLVMVAASYHVLQQVGYLNKNSISGQDS